MLYVYLYRGVVLKIGCVSGADPLKPKPVKAFRTFGAKIVNVYGHSKCFGAFLPYTQFFSLMLNSLIISEYYLE
jgi:hypothetical protein